jgi:hypothetical protein
LGLSQSGLPLLLNPNRHQEVRRKDTRGLLLLLLHLLVKAIRE